MKKLSISGNARHISRSFCKTQEIHETGLRLYNSHNDNCSKFAGFAFRCVLQEISGLLSFHPGHIMQVSWMAIKPFFCDLSCLFWMFFSRVLGTVPRWCGTSAWFVWSNRWESWTEVVATVTSSYKLECLWPLAISWKCKTTHEELTFDKALWSWWQRFKKLPGKMQIICHHNEVRTRWQELGAWNTAKRLLCAGWWH